VLLVRTGGNRAIRRKNALRTNPCTVESIRFGAANASNGSTVTRTGENENGRPVRMLTRVRLRETIIFGRAGGGERKLAENFVVRDVPEERRTALFVVCTGRNVRGNFAFSARVYIFIYRNTRTEKRCTSDVTRYETVKTRILSAALPKTKTNRRTLSEVKTKLFRVNRHTEHATKQSVRSVFSELRANFGRRVNVIAYIRHGRTVVLCRCAIPRIACKQWRVTRGGSTPTLEIFLEKLIFLTRRIYF